MLEADATRIHEAQEKRRYQRSHALESSRNEALSQPRKSRIRRRRNLDYMDSRQSTEARRGALTGAVILLRICAAMHATAILPSDGDN